ncbi:MAG: ankyrin repeat domain-containing protein [Bacteroidia bacterium]|nr:ankyrin repeat domain-containing protein [Bacteroidia bacterium]
MFRAILFLLIFQLYVLFGYAQKPATTSKETKVAPAKSTPKIKSKASIDADADCFINFNGKDIGNLKSGKPRLVLAFVGENILEVTYGTKAVPAAGAKTPAKKETPANANDIIIKKTITIPDTNLFSYKITFFDNEQLNTYLRDGKKDMVELTIQKNPSSLKPKEEEGLNPIITAISKKNNTILRLLLDKGADPNLITGSSPLTVAIQWGNAECLNMLIGAGVKLTNRGDNGMTPLEQAVYWGKYDVVKILLDKGLNPNEKSSDGQTLIETATDKGYVSIIEELKKHGAK